MPRYRHTAGGLVPFTPQEEAAFDAQEQAYAAGAQARAVQRVKAEASRRILSVYPAWRQANMTARGTELTNIRHDRTWTPEEQADADALQASWDWIKQVRAASDAIEAEIPAGAQADAFDVVNREEWPQ